MIIVLVYWKIKPNAQDTNDFLDFWKREAVVDDRTGMIGEFLSEVDRRNYPNITTWNLDDDPESYRCFVNVGLWEDEQAFNEQIAKYFNDNQPCKHFEQARRVRAILRPKCWRIGDPLLPEKDSGGVM